MALNMKKEFIPVNIALMTVSDTRTEENDLSGKLLAKKIEEMGHVLFEKKIVVDELPLLIEQLNEWIDSPEVNIVIATGGTGVTGRDVTPEAFYAVYEKEIPGFGELFRWISFQKIQTSTIQSRATAGVAKGTYLFALPGSPGACRDAWDEILIHQLDSRYRPCNFIDLLPRLKE